MAIDFSDQRIKYISLAALMIAALGYFIFYQRLYKPNTKKIEQAEERLTTLRTYITISENFLAQNDEEQLRKQLEELEHQVVEVETLLPSKQELPQLLSDVTRLGIDSGVKFTLFKPLPEGKNKIYKEEVYQITVIGGYHQIASFLGSVAQLPRVVKPGRLTLSRSGLPGRDKLIKVDLQISTFILPNGDSAS